MWALWGEPIDYSSPPCSCGGCYRNEVEDELIAIFDTREDAEAYEVAARLKTKRIYKTYKTKSLLRNCNSAYIDKYDEPIKNPKIDW